MAKKYKILIFVGAIIIVGASIFLWTRKKTEEVNAQLNLQAEMQSKISEQQGQLNQQSAQIDELVKFKEEQQQKENETALEKEKAVIIKQPISNSKTNTGSSTDLDNLKKQQECQKDINEYNECVSDHNAQMAEYSACLAEHVGEKLVPCINPGKYPSCSQPDCDK